MPIGNHPADSNIEIPVQNCCGVRKETAEDRILPMSVEVVLRFVALAVAEHPFGKERTRGVTVEHKIYANSSTED